MLRPASRANIAFLYDFLPSKYGLIIIKSYLIEILQCTIKDLITAIQINSILKQMDLSWKAQAAL
jgi:hypothetical protein